MFEVKIYSNFFIIPFIWDMREEWDHNLYNTNVGIFQIDYSTYYIDIIHVWQKKTHARWLRFSGIIIY